METTIVALLNTLKTVGVSVTPSKYSYLLEYTNSQGQQVSVTVENSGDAISFGNDDYKTFVTAYTQHNYAHYQDQYVENYRYGGNRTLGKGYTDSSLNHLSVEEPLKGGLTNVLGLINFIIFDIHGMFVKEQKLPF